MDESQPRPALLIANYHRDLNRAMERILRKGGYDVDAVETLGEAREKLRANRYALLLCRNAMPDGSAPEFIPEAWAQFQTPGIAMTGTLNREEMAALIPEPALRGVLAFPFNMEQLLSTVRNCVR